MLGISNIFNKDYPEFWKKYTDSFKFKAKKYVVLSIETSGIDPDKDVIMAIAATSVIGNRIIIKDSFEILIQRNHDQINPIVDSFSINSEQRISEQEAIVTLLEYLSNSIIIGHRINFDIEMLDKCLSRMKLGKIRNEAFDIEAMYNKLKETNEKNYSLEEMGNGLKMQLSNHNSVADDAYSIALLFLKLKEKLGIE
jgi:DNA polymerase-3 subunit epsilon